MDLRPLHQSAEDALPRMLDWLRRMVEINSFTTNIVGVNKLGKLTTECFAELGFEPEFVPATHPQHGSHLFLRRGPAEQPPIVLVTHLDTVFPPEEELANDFRWQPDGRRIFGPGTVDNKGGTAMIWLTENPDLSLKASSALTWIMLLVYGIWSTAPFAFVIYYAGLQTVPQDTLESAMIDGASRWSRIRYVVLPHLLPLTVFMALIKIMDNFRVFEPIVSFNAGAHAQSLSYFIYADLSGETRLLSSAAATSVLTILGVLVLLSPVLVRTWRQFGKA